MFGNTIQVKFKKLDKILFAKLAFVIAQHCHSLIILQMRIDLVPFDHGHPCKVQDT